MSNLAAVGEGVFHRVACRSSGRRRRRRARGSGGRRRAWALTGQASFIQQQWSMMWM